MKQKIELRGEKFDYNTYVIQSEERRKVMKAKKEEKEILKEKEKEEFFPKQEKRKMDREAGEKKDGQGGIQPN